jgi:DNA-binding XRE family transcriptional regulator
MGNNKYYAEKELAELAKEFRAGSGKTKEEAAKELGVARSSLQLAEGTPEQSLTRLRIRMIEKYSPYKVTGPVYLLEKK